MRIVHVVRQFYPAVGGLEDVVSNLARAQAAAGHRVRVVTLDRIFKAQSAARLAPRETFAGVEIRRIPFWGSTRYPIAPAVLRHIGDADLVHVHGVCFFADFLAATRLLHGRRLVLTTHGGFFHSTFAARLKQLYFHTITRASLTRFAAVVAVSEADRARFALLRRKRLVTIDNGADLAAFRNAGSPAPRKSLLALGRFAENKGLDDLIALLAALRARDPEWRLIIAGRPYDFDAATLRETAARAGAAAGLVVLQSPSSSEVRRAMGEASFIASASRFEGFGVAIVEGLAAGLLPCLSDIPPFRRFAALAPGSLILDFRDREAAGERLIAHWRRIAPAYAALRSAAMECVRVFDWEHTAERYEAVYKTALGQSSRSS